MKMKNLGEKCLNEIISKLGEHGLKLGDLSEPLVIETEETIDKNTINLFDINFSVRSYNCLRRAGIETLADLENLSYEELINIRSLNQKCIEEIISEVKKFGITFEEEKKSEDIDQEIESTRIKRDKLQAEMEEMKARMKEMQELMSSYDKLLGEEKTTSDIETPDFNDE